MLNRFTALRASGKVSWHPNQNSVIFQLDFLLVFFGNPFIDQKLTGKMTVTERDIRKYCRCAKKILPGAFSGVRTIVNRLSSTSWVDFHYSFVQNRRKYIPKKYQTKSVTLCHTVWHRSVMPAGRPYGRPAGRTRFASFYSNFPISNWIFCGFSLEIPL